MQVAPAGRRDTRPDPSMPVIPMIENDDTQRVDPVASPDVEPPVLEAVVVAYPDENDECTIFPVDADEVDLLTRWITAEEGSFVDLIDMR